ncbi:glycosyltransferase family 4 protein [Mesorhizobium sp.]|jgi:glycosyltransferase involved in cell wall biosynthesis|uniref:glycosyltransferase family 4 protein n=1 Tax=Mesorhizobium sp. TaxID=1871066 RepID=UPI000FE3AF06|nr:glycosyltransferase family 4 protein [Mesorhizobium sp.]RWH73528.1 MAG: glycosyltransferase family 1 protein [Mesorhizobium sp.]RWL31345.1 MAG: glycosyltransferase family 1 protein [Mesorhizobium sp.]RWL36594.1 MAG: glycosyltransferase family 1 protein [Mesorhizobium sp.]RWL40646.1 MAG: glycosyltransferase family 1 protein [Mesorhizobium sp.]RWL58746.1 MAG: glycosyltransferase family 1 protein [Mesorhizobium sp.]
MKPHLVCVGGEDHALRIPFLMEMRERGFRVTAVSSGEEAPFQRHGIAHRSYRFDRFATGASNAGIVGKLRRLILELRPDIVQSFDTKPNLLTPLAVRGRAPVIRTINGLGWTFSSLQPRALALRPVFCCLQLLASFWTAATVFQNRDDQTFFERYGLIGHGESLLIGGSGIDVGAFAAARRLGPSAARLRQEFGLHSAEVVMFVGRLTRQKGIPTLLAAIPKVVAKRPDARFVFVGPWQSEGPFAVDPSEFERFRSHVVLLGERQDVPALLGMADIFAFPTEYREGIPRVLLEAGLAGLPIVASRMPGCSDFIEDGWNGCLVAARDPDALAERIIELLSDRPLAAVLGNRSAAVVRERFALPLIVDQYCDLYDKTTNARSQDGSVRSRPGTAPRRDLADRRLGGMSG